ncbi:succinate dehydrogenase/fumarate reductase iron-sulfur subunit [Shewanella sp. Choline-02u-19]|jgi:fumarate reductase iron-sulfur subunit|uniref:fumarate reductase iron-sulfur subunit n=1 Tax=unclassified Shewanella TaxID=196818 RepID=UPI000C3370C4|nr:MULTISPECIES: fumarate reductase iron-sulfur subunit [unclassified Shewanella]PKG55801.1 succinate dehydrogenase/fumarate reductase iron-sulfur subunit [Shewanella sp. GutDb-MelDb]PKG74989.1 succinate dehydrogenase/fumarate reductase iron-sulfur subunit [Shewanella sp. GutCb]PKH58790.1 succinate dehydrogenase/fumarate reductase iron-sulfur subunit [Shewanella sp. Bg11-22]PKI29064.1 succinate dehydrogenase/fumarate reductase iron-sulfur subunit [Shewanella sp. Choline-02u-19]
MSPEATKGRMLTFNIFRYDPQEPGDKPKMVKYQLEETPGMTVFIALNRLREEQDTSLQFDFVCRAGICGSCAMVINGFPTLACRTLTRKYPKGDIMLMPLPGFELIGDLSVNTGKFMRELAERLKLWLHPISDDLDVHRLEAPMDPVEAAKLYELERCVECGVCVSACATKQMRETFVGAVGMMKLARFELDSRDGRELEDYYHVIGNQDGVFGCMTLLGCQDNCPKDLPHMQQIAYLRRKMAVTLV